MDSDSRIGDKELAELIAREKDTMQAEALAQEAQFTESKAPDAPDLEPDREAG